MTETAAGQRLADALAGLDEWPVETAAAGVTDADGTLGTHGVSAAVLPLASLTKPLTAYAVLIAAQDGLLHLDEPAGGDAPDDATVRHLLAHTSGLPLDRDGPVGTPGRRLVYSNWGYDLLGDLVAGRAGMPFADYLDLEVLAPLGMTDTTLDGPPASAARGSVDNLLAFARELLRPRLLDADLHHEATTVAFPGVDGVLPGYGRQQPNDWGLGVEIKSDKQPHWTGTRLSPATFGHFGQSGSFLWVDPERAVAAASLADRPFGDWARQAWPDFHDGIVDALDDTSGGSGR